MTLKEAAVSLGIVEIIAVYFTLLSKVIKKISGFHFVKCLYKETITPRKQDFVVCVSTVSHTRKQHFNHNTVN